MRKHRQIHPNKINCFIYFFLSIKNAKKFGPKHAEAKLIFLFDTFVFLKYINIFILLEWICLSLDVPYVIISICAGQLWTIGKIELLAKTWVLQIFEWLLPFVWPSHLSDSSPLCGHSHLSDSSPLCGPHIWVTPPLCVVLTSEWLLPFVWPLPFEWLLPFVWPLPFEWLLPFVWPLP